MKKYLQKTIIALACIYAFTACQTGQQADWTKLWLVTQTLEQEQAKLMHSNKVYLNNVKIRTQLTLRQQDIYRHLADLDFALSEQLQNLDKIVTEVSAAVKQTEGTFATQFVESGSKPIALKPLKQQLNKVLRFEDSLTKRYPEALTDKLKISNMLQCFASNKDNIAWAIVYTDLTQWKCDLLRQEKDVFGYYTKKLPMVPSELIPELYLEVITEAQEVMEGEKYQASMFLSKPNKFNPRMAINGQPVPVYYGRAKAWFRPKKTGTFTWKGEMMFKDRGKDTTFTVMTQYRVIPK